MGEISNIDISEINSKLDVLIRLLASSSISEGASIKENAIVLSRAGIPPKQIADILGTTSNTVNVALSQARKSSKTKTTKKTRR